MALPSRKDCFYEGFQAGESGKSVRDNPYPTESQAHNEWERGLLESIRSTISKKDFK